MFVKHGCPRQQPSQNMAKISQVLHFDPPHPEGYAMSVKCEELIDELTVQVWFLFHHQNFKYCTLFVSGTELWTDGQIDKRMDRWTDRQTDDLITRCPPVDLSGRGHKNFKSVKDSLQSSIITMFNIFLAHSTDMRSVVRYVLLGSDKRVVYTVSVVVNNRHTSQHVVIAAFSGTHHLTVHAYHLGNTVNVNTISKVNIVTPIIFTCDEASRSSSNHFLMIATGHMKN